MQKGFVNSSIKDNDHLSYVLDAKGRLKLGKSLQNQYLAAREIDILKCLLKGYSTKEAGLELRISSIGKL